MIGKRINGVWKDVEFEGVVEMLTPDGDLKVRVDDKLSYIIPKKILDAGKGGVYKDLKMKRRKNLKS
jgi:hypothetical protein